MEDLTIAKVSKTWMLSNGQTLREFALVNNINYVTLYRYARMGYSMNKILEKLKLRNTYNNTNVHYAGKKWTVKELAKSHHNTAKCTYTMLYKRIYVRKWSLDRALSEPRKRHTATVYVYNGVTYESRQDLCYNLGLNAYKFDKYIKEGHTVEEAVKNSLIKEIILLKYKGKNYTLSQLVSHPDNIHKFGQNTIQYRTLKLKLSVEDALSIPRSSIKGRPIQYCGKHYPNLLTLVFELGLIKQYHKLTGIYDNDLLTIEINKLLATK